MSLRYDKKCGQSGIPDNAKCSKQTAQGPPQRKPFSNPYKNAVVKLGAGLAAASLAASAAGSLVGGRKAPTAPKKPRLLPPSPFPSTGRRAPSVPPKKETSVTRRLAEIRRKNKANFARPELRDLRAVGLKAERLVSKGTTPAEALKKAATPRLRKRRRDLGSFYKDGHSKTKNVRDRMAKIMDAYKKKGY
mgnify:CR=1 FL=1